MRSFRPLGRLALGVTIAVPAARGVYLLFILSLARVYGASGLADGAFFVAGVFALVTSAVASLSEAVLIPALYRAAASGSDAALLRYMRRYLWLTTVLASALALLWLHGRWPSMPRDLSALCLMPMMAASTAINVARLVSQGRLLSSQMGHGLAGIVVVPAVYVWTASQTHIVVLLLGYEALRWLMTVIMAQRTYLGTAIAVVSASQRQQLWQAALGQLGSYVVSALPPVIGLYLARGMGHGVVSMLEYINRLWSAGTLIFVGYLLYIFNRFNQIRQEAGDAAYVQRSVWRMFWFSLCAIPLAIAACAVLAHVWFSRATWSSVQLQVWIESAALCFLALPAYLVGMIYVRWANSALQVRAIFAAVSAYLVAYLLTVSWTYRIGLPGLVMAFVIGQYAQLWVLSRCVQLTPKAVQS